MIAINIVCLCRAASSNNIKDQNTERAEPARCSWNWRRLWYFHLEKRKGLWHHQSLGIGGTSPIVPHWTFGAPIKTVASLLIYNRNECEWSWPYVVGMKQTARGTCLSHFFAFLLFWRGKVTYCLIPIGREEIFFSGCGSDTILKKRYSNNTILYSGIRSSQSPYEYCFWPG